MKPTTFTVTITSDDVDGWLNRASEARDYIDWVAKRKADYAKEMILDKMEDEWLADYGKWCEDNDRSARDEAADREMEELWLERHGG